MATVYEVRITDAHGHIGFPAGTTWKRLAYLAQAQAAIDALRTDGVDAQIVETYVPDAERATKPWACQECGHSSPKWLGHCPGCGKWNTFVEEKKQEELSQRFTRQLIGFSSEVTPLNKVSVDEFQRI